MLLNVFFTSSHTGIIKTVPSLSFECWLIQLHTVTCDSVLSEKHSLHLLQNVNTKGSDFSLSLMSVVTISCHYSQHVIKFSSHLIRSLLSPS